MSTSPTSPIAVIRWIDESNAESLGYDADDDTGWVMENGKGEWRDDLDGVPEAEAEEAQSRVEELYPWLLETGAARPVWRRLPGNYGTAYELVKA